ncbi:MAG: type II toxin-antitoxin system Phd/YefM family antitoxin [Chloroflexota bacterium]
MKSVGVHEARTHWSRLLDDVAHGESVAITRHGVAAALLVPPQDHMQSTAAEAVDAWRQFRAAHHLQLNDVSIREMIEEGRR